MFFFAAFISHGVCAGRYEESLQRALIVVSEDIRAELEEKLITKARLSPAEVREVLFAVRSDAEVVKPNPLPKPICPDPDDDLMLAVALDGKVNVLVTGDQDLLVLKEFHTILILNLRDGLVMLGQR